MLLVAGATFFWSLSGVFVRWLPATPAWTFNAWRSLGMGLALLLWLLLSQRERAPCPCSARPTRAPS